MVKASGSILLTVTLLFSVIPAEAHTSILAAQILFFDISEEEEIQLGKSAAEQVERENRLVKNRKVAGYVQKLGERLARRSDRPGLKYQFKVIEKDDANAFALPGGFIYLHQGILQIAENESEVAGVLAHEIAHVSERHGIEQVKKAQRIGLGLAALDLIFGRNRGTGENLAALGAQLAAQGVFFKYSRDAEREADRKGVEILRKNGTNPRGMVTLFQRMESLRERNPGRVESFFSSHPSLRERQENISGSLTSGDSRLRSDSRDFQTAKKELGK